MSNHARKRHVAKAITWRLVGTIVTVLLAWIISGDPTIGLQIGVVETITKMVLYYLHERFWYNLDLKKHKEFRDSRRRHLTKTLTWRIVGSIDTVILSWVISGNPLIGLKIGVVDAITKMALYYLHERAWHKINYGLPQRPGED